MAKKLSGVLLAVLMTLPSFSWSEMSEISEWTEVSSPNEVALIMWRGASELAKFEQYASAALSIDRLEKAFGPGNTIYRLQGERTDGDFWRVNFEVLITESPMQIGHNPIYLYEVVYSPVRVLDIVVERDEDHMCC
jgi:hypothetical protein